MANQIKFIKATTLPGTLEPDSFYFIENGTYAESYLTNTAGVARSIGNSAMINALASSVVAAANNMQVVANITARDALAPTSVTLALVLDATGDATVAAGAATYVWDTSGAGAWIKIAEYESMDVVVTWASITGKPTSSVADIDDAVAKRHAHANLTQLDKIGEDANGHLTYDGNPVSVHWDTKNW